MFSLPQSCCGGTPLCPGCHCLGWSDTGSFLTSLVPGSQKGIGHNTSIKMLKIFVLSALDVVWGTTSLEILFYLNTSGLSEA